MSAAVNQIMADALAGAEQSRRRHFHRAWVEAEGAFQRAGGRGYDAVKAYDEAFIHSYLFCRELPAEDVIREAMAAGIHPSDVGDAIAELGVKTIVNGGAKVIWALPDETYLRLQEWARTGYVPGPADALTRLIYSHSPPKRKPAKAPRSAGRSPNGR